MPRSLAPATPPLSASLAGRLFHVIFGCYFVVTLVVTVAQLGTEYQYARGRLDADIQAMQRTFSPGLADAMWRFNSDVLRGILRGMKEMPVVIGIEVRDEHGHRVEALGAIEDVRSRGEVGGESRRLDSFDSFFRRTFDLVHVDENGDRHPVGSWSVISSDRIALDQVRETLIVIVINSAIKTLALWFIFFIVIRRMVGRPLVQIGAFLAELDVDNLGDKPCVIDAKGRHELHALTDALNLMTTRLQRSFAENAALLRQLRDVNATLQDKVAERTRELELLARTDLLTGLYNRRKLDEAIDDAMVREDVPFCVILGDIDHFKSINDQYGHKDGDAVLTAFAAALRGGIRAEDTLGRWGGEEFMVLCPGADLASAAVLAERLRQRIEATELPSVGARTCSFGVAERLPGESADGLIVRVDAALYRAKRNGRNRIEASAGPDEADDRRRSAA